MNEQVLTLSKSIFKIRSKDEFELIALEIFQFQANHNPLYSSYLNLLSIDPSEINSTNNIPFLPIEFFKNHTIKSSDFEAEAMFTSSGTTGTQTSQHHIKDLKIYEDSFTLGFETFYGGISDYTITCLLPSYIEQESSSLIFMADSLAKKSNSPQSGFYLDNYDKLKHHLLKLKAEKKKTILLGVSFALLDFTESHHISFPELIVMETGGMKGRREELTREELHAKLKRGFDVPFIHSEYGMTELLSQAYSQGNGKFRYPPWMRVSVREINDPLNNNFKGTGGLNIIDLANIYSCSFIATQDLGKLNSDGTFEVLGRFDHTDVRGCNLLI